MIPQSNSIECVGADDNRRTFYFIQDEDSDETSVVYHVYDSPTPTFGQDPPFVFVFEFQADRSLRQTGIDNFGDARYSAMGIPDVFLPLVKQMHDVDVRSSPSDGSHEEEPAGPGIFRTPEVTKMWERLCRKGLADYDAATDIYSVL